MAESAATRPYKLTVTIGDNTQIRIVRAVSPAAAIKHVTEDTVKCEILTADDAFVLGARGVVIEEAKKATEPAAEPQSAPGT